MKRSISVKLLSCLLVLAMMLMTSAVAVSAEAETNSGQYVKDVFIAYGEDEARAELWLIRHGWEPIADLNDGKSSHATGMHNAVAVMGIKRTNNPNEAITDMAVMNMGSNEQRGYSFDDYESLVAQKKADINEFINTFVPALQEYRNNYKGQGSKGGQKRAQAAHDLLNKFFDGDPNGEYAVNDTGKPLGDLLLHKTKTEMGEEAYNKLSAEQKLGTADLQQIILESSGPAVQIIEQILALATDTAETSWLDRLDGLTGEDLVDRIAEFAPEAIGQDLAPSAAMSLLASHFEDYSKRLAAQWSIIHEDILWYESYCDAHDLWPDDETILSDKAEPYFAALHEENEERYQDEFKRFNLVNTYYKILKEITYSGEWGETLYNFFRPEDESADYSEEYTYFAPLAAALSDGQRAALEFLTLPTLLKLGANIDADLEIDLPSVNTLFKDKDGQTLDSISVYSGINRAIFRKGVALTSDALMQKNMGKDPYDMIWEEGGMADIVAYSALAAGTINLAVGIGMTVRASQAAAQAADLAKIAADAKIYAESCANMHQLEIDAFITDYNLFVDNRQVNAATTKILELIKGDVEKAADKLFEAEIAAQKAADKAAASKAAVSGMSTAGKWMMGIGGVLMIAAAALKGVQIYKYYHRDFTMIPVMIVDEADIVSYTTDNNGKQVKLINFDQFAYYEVVKCNRQEIGIHTNAQDGVSEYKNWGCGDAADINADVGIQWLALYVNRSAAKGNPILADSFKLQKGTDKTPDDCNGCLHMFTYTNAMKLDDDAYCYRDDNKGMYLFWKGDETAFAESTSTGANTASETPASTASAFNSGYLALAGIGGLALGILGTTIVLIPKLKKKKEQAAG